MELKEIIWNLVKDISPDYGVLIFATFPVTELRAAIPVAIAMGMEPWRAFYLAVVGNFIPIIPLLLLLPSLIDLSRKIPIFDRLLTRILTRTRKKSKRVEKYGALGLMFFVGIPAPGTGVWTGSLIAYLLGIRPLYAVFAMMGGVILAGLLVTLGSIGVLESVKYFSAPVILAFILVIIVVVMLLKKGNNNI